MDIPHIADWAKLKGINLMGTGDFTHHLWLEELKRFLEPNGKGLFIHKGIHFILTAEISSIYSKNNRTYRIHNLILAPSFKIVDEINRALGSVGNLASDGRPILGLDAADLARIVFDIDENRMLIPGHIWTPWFSLFGSNSGFDRIEDCFEESTQKIFALETGLSSDPLMNWRLSALDRFSLVSNSDSHSPSKIGREANVFNCDLDYFQIREVLKNKDKKKFLYTIEFFPEEGKYHYDGHRLCGVCLSPEESKKNSNRCPKCKKPLTIGVMNRVCQLSDREAGFIPKNAIPYKNLVSLDEIIAEAKNLGKATAGVEKEHRGLISRYGTEFEILMSVPQEELNRSVNPKIAEGIARVRADRVRLDPGYDGEYGKVHIFGTDEDKKLSEEQMSLF
ncbi:MAG TPA: endonuclease Q family protein [Candidatus Omnitrophota bacterium]|nr:endonuclease Q family protein [Candidatus Omnitrophota bacterium]